MSKITVDRRLCLTADGELVEQDDPAAAFLWASAGREVDADEAAALGYEPASGDVDEPDVDDTAEADDDPDDVLCAGVTASGAPCSKKAGDDGYCHFHSE